MRILYTFFIGIAITTMYGCNDSSSGNGNAANNSAGEAVAENTGGNPEPNIRGPLGVVIDQADGAVHGKVVSIDTVYSDDPLRTPHQVVSIEIAETIMGDFEHYGTDIATVSFVGGAYEDGIREIAASNSPSVAVGDEVVALITEHDNHPCTLTQCAKGLFQVKDGRVIAENGATVVVDKNHKVNFVSKGAQAKGQYKGLIDKGSLRNFIDHLANLAKTSNSKAKAQRTKLVKLDITQPFAASPSLTTPTTGPTTNEENAKREATRKAAREKYLAGLTPEERWEVEAFEANNGSPVLPNSYLGEGQQ